MNFIENQIKFRKSNQNRNQEIKVSLLKINFNIVAPYLYCWISKTLEILPIPIISNGYNLIVLLNIMLDIFINISSCAHSEAEAIHTLPVN